MLNIIDEIKSRVDIVELISSYLKLQKVGANFKTLCPFHSEKNPSFFVSPARQIWHCFGCGKGGDVFKFIMEIEGVEFADALRVLAQRAGVQLKPIEKEIQTKRKRLYDLLEWATRFFEVQLEKGKLGLEAKKYLISRKISEQSIKKWRLGWAPNSPSALIDFLKNKGFKREEIFEAGLAIKNERENFFDRFRSRIIFPIFDLNSQVIGFGGRIFLSQDGAKYINTPNTLLYEKSKVVYGLDKGKVEIRKRDFAILTEGYIDCILCQQSGFENTVAVSGTSLTAHQLQILKRYTDNLYLAFDMDWGGEEATERGINLAQSLGFSLKVVILPKDKDPSDIISENEKEWENLIKDAKPIMEYYFEILTSKFDKNSLAGKKSISKILLPIIKQIPNEIEKGFWLEKLAQEIRVKSEELIKEMGKIKTEQEKYGLEESEILATKKSRKEILEERLVILCLKNKKNFDKIKSEFLDFLSEKTKKVLDVLKNNKEIGPEISDYFNYLLLKSEIEDIQDEDSEDEINFCQREIEKLKAKEELERISEQIKIAEIENDFDKIKNLSEEFKFWSQKIK